MSIEFELNKTNRLRLAQAFRHSPRVDLSIDCVLEDQMGRALVDDARHPGAFCINIGPFWYFAGHADCPGGQALLRAFPAYNLLMPSPPEWIAAAQAIYQERLVSSPRYSFKTDSLSKAHLQTLFERSPHPERIIPIDTALARRLAALEAGYFEIEAFDSPEDFAGRGLGYAALDGAMVMGVAYSSLVCSWGIEVSIFVEEHYRQRGIATALAIRLVLESLRLGLHPNWDAANPESCKLALKLGYSFSGSYEAYYWTPEQVAA